MPVTWLHVSDFHLSDKGPYNQEIILRSLVSSVKRFREKEGQVPDLIFATGDIANQGSSKEYEYATTFFDDLLYAAGLKRDRLFIVPGNHDVQRKAGKFLARTIGTKNDADEYFNTETTQPHLILKFNAFAEWYNNYFRDIRIFPTNTTCSQIEIVTIGNIRVSILPLNSALFSIDDHDHQKLFIGRRCLDAAKKQLGPADLTIALIHHPLDWLSWLERSNIKAVLSESVDLLLHGHYHETETESIVSENGGYLILAAGASWQTRQYPNTAMYVTYDSGQVTVFPIRYEDTPYEVWTLDTSVFPFAKSNSKSITISRRTNNNSPYQSENLVNRINTQESIKHEAEYQAMLKEELGYIRLIGLPGIESIKVNLNDDTFVPLRLTQHQNSRKYIRNKSTSHGNEEDVHILFPDEIMRRAFKKRRMLLIVGDPGAGKTTLLKYYTLCALDNYEKIGFDSQVGVYYLPLRELLSNKKGRYHLLPENLALWANKHHIPIEVSFFQNWLRDRKSLVLLDGLDEISNTSERIEVCKWIDSAWTGFSKACFVITTRETGYRKDDGVELEADYERADVQDFTLEQQEIFLTEWFTAAFLKETYDKDIDDVQWEQKQISEAKKRTSTIIAHLKAEQNKSLRQLAAIPMILQIMAILWKDRDYMPESRVELYKASLDYLLEFKDKRRGILPILSAERSRQILAPVSLWMQEIVKKDEVDRVDMYDVMQKELNKLNKPPSAFDFCDYLVKRAGLLSEYGQNDYVFRHKSFREYLSGVELVKKVLRTSGYIDNLIRGFNDDWWEEPIRFFIAQGDAEVFDLFMKKLFESPISDALTTKQQLLLQTIIEEAPLKKVDAFSVALMDSSTTANRQRVILDCLKTIGNLESLDIMQKFRSKKLAKTKEVANRTTDVIIALGGQPLDNENYQSFRNLNENSAEYIMIPEGRYIYSQTEAIVYVPNLYFAKYPVTNKLYRSFINSLHPRGLAGNDLERLKVFSEALNTIAKNKTWGRGFRRYLNEGKSNLANLFRSRYDEDRKYDGDDQPVVGITWYAASAYCLWISLLEGEASRYRLPTEIEWEWASGGRQGSIVQKVRQYPWTEEKGEPSSKLANYGQTVGATTPVGNYPEGVTPEGLYDMAGNVYEQMGNMRNVDSCAHALRGGSWLNLPNALCCISRNISDLLGTRTGSNVGFRVMRSNESIVGGKPI